MELLIIVFENTIIGILVDNILNGMLIPPDWVEEDVVGWEKENFLVTLLIDSIITQSVYVTVEDYVDRSLDHFEEAYDIKEAIQLIKQVFTKLSNV